MAAVRRPRRAVVGAAADRSVQGQVEVAVGGLEDGGEQGGRRRVPARPGGQIVGVAMAAVDGAGGCWGRQGPPALGGRARFTRRDPACPGGRARFHRRSGKRAPSTHPGRIGGAQRAGGYHQRAVHALPEAPRIGREGGDQHGCAVGRPGRPPRPVQPGAQGLHHAGRQVDHLHRRPGRRSHEGDAAPVRRPRRQGGGGPSGYPAGGPRSQVVHVQVERPVPVGSERKAAALGRPGRVGFDPGVAGEALRIPADGVQPEVAQRRERHPRSVGRDRRRDDAAHRERTGRPQVTWPPPVVGPVERDRRRERHVPPAASVAPTPPHPSVAGMEQVAIGRPGRTERKDVLLLSGQRTRLSSAHGHRVQARAPFSHGVEGERGSIRAPRRRVQLAPIPFRNPPRLRISGKNRKPGAPGQPDPGPAAIRREGDLPAIRRERGPVLVARPVRQPLGIPLVHSHHPYVVAPAPVRGKRKAGPVRRPMGFTMVEPAARVLA